MCCFTSFSVDFHSSVFYKIPNTKCIPLKLFSVMMFCLYNFENVKHFDIFFLTSTLMLLYISVFSAFLHLPPDDFLSQSFLGFSTYWFPKPFSMKPLYLFTSLSVFLSTKLSSREHTDNKTVMSLQNSSLFYTSDYFFCSCFSHLSTFSTYLDVMSSFFFLLFS